MHDLSACTEARATDPTRVLVVDDSPTMRRLITATLARDPRVVVVAQAGTAEEARDAVVREAPDVITLDVEMPGMSGLEFLERLMKRRPIPVIMISTLTGKGSALAIEALSLGAVDCIGKPDARDCGSWFEGLADRVVAAADAPPEALGSAGRQRQTAGDPNFAPNGRIVCIGASTGGVDALTHILIGYPENCPPTVIVQHMPPGFTRSFADRLSRICKPMVSEARDGDMVRPGTVLIAPGGTRHLEIRGRNSCRCQCVEGAPVSDHRPSVDVLFRSAAALGDRAVGVILTGMGHDGAEGLGRMRQNGARTIAQDRESSVVYGMSRVAVETGAADTCLPLDRIGPEILELCRA